jgi:hypothetical protein
MNRVVLALVGIEQRGEDVRAIAIRRAARSTPEPRYLDQRSFV